MNIGKLRNRIIFQNYQEVINEVKESVLRLQDLKTVWAAVEPLRGREYLEAQKTNAELTYRITIRYTTGITPDMKIKFKERIFEIIDIINVEEKNEVLQIMCTEKVLK